MKTGDEYLKIVLRVKERFSDEVGKPISEVWILFHANLALAEGVDLSEDELLWMVREKYKEGKAKNEEE